MPVWAQHSTLADEIQANAVARFPETDLKQVLWETGSWRERPKYLKDMVGRTGGEPVAH
jgi:hypothetical protein